MKQEIAWTNRPGVEAAVNDLMRQINKGSRDCRMVLFCASVSYDFYELSARLKNEFPDSEVIGCSTSGEISKNGFTKNSIVLTTMCDPGTNVKAIAIRSCNRYPMIYRKDIIAAMNSCGIKENDPNSHKNAFAMTFVNGLCNAEESLLALLYAVVGNEDFRVIGGSAGDDLRFDTTYTSYNGQVVTDGGIVVFIKTNKKFLIETENIFVPSGRKVTLTSADTLERRIDRIDGSPAAMTYSRALGIPESSIGEASLLHPLGRSFGNDIFITSIASVNPDKSFQMYSRVIPNTMVDIMELADVETIMEDTCRKIQSQIARPGFLFLVNCILRTLQFESTGMCKYMTDTYAAHFADFCGFSSYGEQTNKVNANQTLIVLAMEE